MPIGLLQGLYPRGPFEHLICVSSQPLADVEFRTAGDQPIALDSWTEEFQQKENLNALRKSW
jgi:hypothetical protein